MSLQKNEIIVYQPDATMRLEVFVRLNSTGKALTRQEILNAKYV